MEEINYILGFTFCSLLLLLLILYFVLTLANQIHTELRDLEKVFKKTKADERAKVIDEVKDLIKARLVDSLALENATKYGNKNAEQQANSYATVMKYEIADCIDDLLADVELLKEQK